MATKKRKSKIDGLYYLNAEMLRKADACSYHLGRWIRFFGEADVPITREVIERMHTRLDWTIGWAMNHMYIGGKITHAERTEATNLYYRSRTGGQRNAFIRLLEKRARREGRLA